MASPTRKTTSAVMARTSRPRARRRWAGSCCNSSSPIPPQGPGLFANKPTRSQGTISAILRAGADTKRRRDGNGVAHAAPTRQNRQLALTSPNSRAETVRRIPRLEPGAIGTKIPTVPLSKPGHRAGGRFNTMVDHPDPRKTDRPEDEKTTPDVPKPPPPADEGDKGDNAAFDELMRENEDLVVTPDSGPFAPEAAPEPPLPSPSSAVDLGRHKSPSPSGQAASDDASSFPWEDLVRDEKQSSSGAGEPARFDSPSDADVIQTALGESAGGPPDMSDSAVGAAAVPSRESSRVDLAEGAGGEDPLASTPHPREPEAVGADSAIFVAEAGVESGEPVESEAQVFSYDSSAELEGGVREVEEGSAVDLDPAHAQRRPEDSSGIDLGGGGGAAGPIIIDSSSDLDLEGAIILEDEEEGEQPSSMVELGASEPVITVDSASVLPSSKPEVLPTESSQSDVFVGADVGPAAEAVSSGISGFDLSQPASPVVQVDSSSGMNIAAEPEEIEESMGTIALSAGEALPEGADAASNVNLGMPLEEKGSDRDLIAEAVESGVDLDRPPEAASGPSSDVEMILGAGDLTTEDSVVDLGGPAIADDEGSLKESDAAADFGLAVTNEWHGDARGRGKETQVGQDEFIPHPVEEHGDAFEAAVDLEAAHSEAAAAGAEVDDSAVRTFEDRLPAGVGAEEEMMVGSEAVVEEADAGSLVVGEEALAGAAAEEEAAAEKKVKEKEEEEKRVPPPKPKYGRRLVGGALIGTLVGTAACVGLWMYGVEPPKAWRQVATTPDDQKGGSGRPPGGGSVPPGGGRPATLDDMLSNGDFSKDPPPINEADAGERTKRGRYQLLRYLSATDPKAYKLTDDAVKNALADLDEGVKGGNADAFLWKGYVYEKMNDPQEATKIYQLGAEQFKGDRVRRAQFEGALDRVQLQGLAKAAGALLSPPLHLDAAQLALLALLLQPPMPPGEQPAGPPAEAGFSFW